MTAHQDRRTDGLTLTPDAGLAVQPSSAVAVLVSIKVSEGQKEKMVRQKNYWTVKLLRTVNVSDKNPGAPLQSLRLREEVC